MCQDTLKTKDIIDYEPKERLLLEPLFAQCSTFWDVGAQIGFYSIVAALNGVPNVVAVDIDPYYSRIIKEHAKYNNLNITVQNIAIGISGNVVIFKNYGRTSKMKALSLDELWEKTEKKPDLIKIDIDGGEESTLVGSPRLFMSHNAPKLIMEFANDFSDINRIKKILDNYGYHFVAAEELNQLWEK